MNESAKENWSFGVEKDYWDPKLDEIYGLYDRAFESAFREWLAIVALSAAKGKSVDTICRIDSVLKRIHSGPEASGSGWRQSWMKWRKEPWHSLIRSILAALARGGPPVELWASEADFTDVSNSFNCTVSTLFTVDHDKHKIKFVWFEGLPGDDG